MSTIFRDLVTMNGFQFNVPSDQPAPPLTIPGQQEGEFNEVFVELWNGLSFFCDMMDGWDDSPEPSVAVSAFGVSDGVVASRRFPYNEKYVEISGYVLSANREAATFAKELLAELFDSSTPISITRMTGASEGKRLNVRAVSTVEFPEDFAEQGFRWIVRVMAPWPFRLGIETRTGTAVPFAPVSYYRLYPKTYRTDDNLLYYRTYRNSLSDATLTPVVEKVNLIKNPVPVNTTRFNTNSAVSSFAINGAYIRMTRIIAASGSIDTIEPLNEFGGGNGQNAKFPAVPGQEFAARVKIRGHATKTMYVRCIMQFWVWDVVGNSFTGVGPEITGAMVTVAPNAVVILEIAAQAPDAEDYAAYGETTNVDLEFRAHLNAAGTTSLALNDYIDFAEFALDPSSQETPVEYFTGSFADSTDGFTTYEFEAASNASPSIKYRLVESAPQTPDPDFVAAVNNGNATSYPTIRVRGPLNQNAWYIVEEKSGARLFVPQAVPAGVWVVFDSFAKTAFLGAEEVSYFIQGTWPQIGPRSDSSFRLVTSVASPDARIEVVHDDTWR